ncbi:hypothetical protein AB0H18_19885 [Streptomyces sp. NPDC020766]
MAIVVARPKKSGETTYQVVCRRGAPSPDGDQPSSPMAAGLDLSRRQYP